MCGKGGASPENVTVAGAPPIVIVTGVVRLAAPSGTWPAGTTGSVGPNPVPYSTIVSPCLTGAGSVAAEKKVPDLSRRLLSPGAVAACLPSNVSNAGAKG